MARGARPDAALLDADRVRGHAANRALRRVLQLPQAPAAAHGIRRTAGARSGGAGNVGTDSPRGNHWISEYYSVVALF